jgi:putative nucleotidyltransferase with HDIG domain
MTTTIGKKTAYALFIIIVIMTAGFMLYSLETAKQDQIQLSKQKLLQEAIAHFDNMVVTRSWSANYGGVYVKKSAGLTPNSYLKDNFILDTKGNTLIKINPAWMTRQISELSNQRSHYFYKITSLKPLNPHNAADAFETEALRYFESHKDEKYYYRLSSDNKSFDFMGALKIEPACLTCHENQGYALGDVRGGIRISIPTDLFQQELLALQSRTSKDQAVVAAGAILVLGAVSYFLTRIYRYQQNIERLNQSLEAKVIERTNGLAKMYQHEKYVKDLLSIATNVNELLLTAVSMQSVLQNSVEQLAKHSTYQSIWVGLINNDQLEIAHRSDKNYDVLEQDVYSLTTKMNNQQVSAAIQAIIHNRTVIERYKPLLREEYSTIKANDESTLHWFLTIPLQCTDAKQAFGVFAIYSDRPEGFESEEINILERLAMDIGLILHSHQQKAILDAMETHRIANYEETIFAFVNIIEQRDTYTAGHTIRVAEYCKKIAEALGVDKIESKKLERAAILHDIGKVATPDAVLLKPNKLTAIEYELIKQHANAGYNMLAKIDMYKDLAEIIRYHHARYDGKGYPETKHPDDVPFLAHIMAVADAFDAMTSNRIYKPRLTVPQALAEIQRYSGTQFHPIVAEMTVKVLANIEITHTSQIPSNELEQKRFSYFFCDSLTELYNEHYLQIALTNNEQQHIVLILCLLQDFSQYNKKFGWNEGNQLLIQFAKQLKNQFPDATVFRYHGDDFVLLFDQPIVWDNSYFTAMKLLKETGICVQTKQFILDVGEHHIPF